MVFVQALFPACSWLCPHQVRVQQARDGAGNPRDSAGGSWGSQKVLGHVPAGSLGGLAGHGEVQKATGSSNIVSPLATGCPWDIPICAPQSPLMRASSFCPHTLTWTMGLHPLTSPFPGSQPYGHILPIRLGIWNHCQSSHSGHSWSVAKPQGSGGSFGHASTEQERGRQQGKDGAGLWPPALTASPLVQSPAARDESREDKTTIKCETSPPSSPRTLRLEKLGHPALSQEDGKRYVEILGISVGLRIYLGHTWNVGWAGLCHGLCPAQE